MNRTGVSIVLGALLATGCLFPSFDDVRGGRPEARTEANATDDEGRQTDAASGGDAASGSAPGTNAPADAATEAAPRAPGTIKCGGSTCLVGPGSYCCAGFQFGSTCGDPGGEDACRSFGQAHVLTCDDDADCDSGQSCCLPDGAKTSTCSVSCSGRVLCNPQAPSCPSGKTCTGVMSLGSGASISVCQ